MSKEDFLLKLKKALKKMPKQEVDDAIAYYTEYLEDVGSENEQSTIQALGSPDQVATKIIAEFAVKNMKSCPSAKKGISTVWVVLLAIFASPIAVPLALAIAAVALSLVVVLIAFIISFAAISICLLATGVIMAVIGLGLITQNLATAAFYFGSGLFAFGIGLALFPLVIWLSKKGFNGIISLINKCLPRRKAL